MKTRENDFDQIERYLDGNIDEDEMSLFEQQFQKNPELNNNIDIVKKGRKLIVQHSLLEVKELIKQEESKYFKNILIKKWVVFLSLLLVIISSLYIYSKISKKDEVIKLDNTTQKENNFEQNSFKTPLPISLNEPSLPFIESKKNSSKVESEMLIQKPTGESISSKQLPIELPKNESLTISEIISALPNEEVLDINSISDNPKEKTIPIPFDNKKIDCSLSSIESEIDTKPSCNGLKAGSIHLHLTVGGKAPYQYAINNSGLKKSGVFENLLPGKYTIQITDKDGCSKVLSNILIESKDCRKHFDFNPFAGELWKVPEELGLGHLTIYDRAGKIYFEKEITGGEKESWTGISASGEIIPGYYLFSMKGENNQLQQGSITISGK